MTSGLTPGWPIVHQDPQPSIFVDPATGRGRINPSDPQGRPYNILYWTVLERYGLVKPPKDSKSDKIIPRLLGRNFDGTHTLFPKLDAWGILTQSAGQYLPNTTVPTADARYGKYDYTQGIGFGGRGRATLFFRDEADPDTAHPKPVPIEGFNSGVAAQQRQLNSMALSSSSFPAVAPAPQEHGTVSSDQTMLFYDQTIDVLFEMEKVQRAFHFPQRHTGPNSPFAVTVEDFPGTGGWTKPGGYVWKVTVLGGDDPNNPGHPGESDAKPHNLFDDGSTNPSRTILMAAGQQARLRWESPPCPAGASVPTGWRLYRGTQTGTGALDNCLLIDEIPFDIATAGTYAEYVDTGTYWPPASAKKAPVNVGTQLNTAWTPETRVSTPVGILHQASKCLGHYENRSDSLGQTESIFWGPAATKIPIPAGWINEYEFRQFAQLRDTWINATGSAKTTARAALDAYTFPHALSMAAPKPIESIANFGYPAQSCDGSINQADALLQGALHVLDPDFDWRTMDARCQALKDLNTAPTAKDSGGPNADGVAFIDKCSELTKCVVRTMQKYGFFFHDSNPANFIFYLESPDMAVARDTSDPYQGDWTDLLIGNTEVANVNASTAASRILKKQIRRTQELGAIPWDQVYMPLVTRCSTSALAMCTYDIGQVVTDTQWDIGDAVMGDSFADSSGTDLGDHKGVHQDGSQVPWAENTATTGSIVLGGGKTRAPIIPALYYLTRQMPSPDYSVKSEFRVYDDFTTLVVGGAFLFEHVHRLQYTDRRHYIGVGYNSANRAIVVRAMVHPDLANPPVSQPLAQFDMSYAADAATPRHVESYTVGNSVYIVVDGVALDAEVPIPAGYSSTGYVGLNVAYPQADQSGISLDGMWFYDKQTPTPPGRFRRVVRTTEYGIVDLLAGVTP